MTGRYQFNKAWPLLLTAGIIGVDQLTKWVIVKNIPMNTVGWRLWNDFFRIIHVRNLGIAFSLGNGWPEFARKFLFIILPLAVLAVLFIYYLKDRSLTRIQGWAIAGILGGGVGNILDRIFRPEGVVDFLDFRFYGLFGMERFPTFNVADSSVVVCGILLVISFFIEERSRTRKGMR